MGRLQFVTGLGWAIAVTGIAGISSQRSAQDWDDLSWYAEAFGSASSCSCVPSMDSMRLVPWAVFSWFISLFTDSFQAFLFMTALVTLLTLSAFGLIVGRTILPAPGTTFIVPLVLVVISIAPVNSSMLNQIARNGIALSIALISLAWALQRRWALGLVSLGLATIVHSYMGVLTAAGWLGIVLRRRLAYLATFGFLIFYLLGGPRWFTSNVNELLPNWVHVDIPTGPAVDAWEQRQGLWLVGDANLKYVLFSVGLVGLFWLLTKAPYARVMDPWVGVALTMSWPFLIFGIGPWHSRLILPVWVLLIDLIAIVLVSGIVIRHLPDRAVNDDARSNQLQARYRPMRVSRAQLDSLRQGVQTR